MSLIVPPAFASKSDPSDIVAINLQNSSTSSVASQYITFGQVFSEGALRPNDSLKLSIQGNSYQVQMDAKTFYEDGSVEMAVLTVKSPDLPPGSTSLAMLQKGGQSFAETDPVDVLGTMLPHSLVANIGMSDGSDYHVDILSSLRSALQAGSVTEWLRGPEVTQVSFSIPVLGSFRIQATVSAYADGTYSAKLGFNNDVAMSQSGGSVTYSVSIIQDANTVLNKQNITQAQYQDWSAELWSDSNVHTSVNVQHDPGYLESFGAIPNYDLTSGVSASLIAAEQTSLNSPGWGEPLAGNGITAQFPTTGGRGDIGPTTQANAAWLVSQDETAARYALGQADAAGAVPWNYWLSSSQTYLNTSFASDAWTDLRGGPGSWTTGLTQQYDPSGSGWALDTAHQPDLSYYAFIMTGDQQYLRSLNAQASFSITDTWPGYRGPTGELVVGHDQVRAQAWSLREIDEASYANPTGSADAEYFTHIADVNWQWLVAQIPTWTALQGQAYGQVEGYYGDGSGNRISPWMQDYFASTAVQAAEHGNEDALTFLKWESNFLVGRFLQDESGFNPRDGIAYNLVVGDGAGGRLATWAGIETATVNAGNSNGEGWGQSQGDYGELALQALAGIITLTGSDDAIKAYNYLITSGAPFIDSGTRSSDIQFDIVPRLPSSMTFALDGRIIPVQNQSAESGNGSSSDPLPATAPAAPQGDPSPELQPQGSDSSTGPSSGSELPSDPSTPGVLTQTPPTTEIEADPVVMPPTLSAASPLPPSSESDSSQLVSPESSNNGPAQSYAPAPFSSSPVTSQLLSNDAGAVYRFFDSVNGTQFLTSSVAERDLIEATRPDLKFEGSAMGSVSTNTSDSNVGSVYRFFDLNTGTHLFTTSKVERDSIISSRTDLVFEGSNFAEHLSPEVNDVPVFRFFNTTDGSHFFTASATECAAILQNRHELAAEGVAFYAPRT